MSANSDNKRIEISVGVKIQSFLEHGIISSASIDNKGITNTSTSNDEQKVEGVFLNCISSTQGIYACLFNPAKGAFVVGLEETVGENGILDAAIKRNKATLTEAEENIKNQFGSLVTPTDKLLKSGSRNKVLPEDATFLSDVSNKTHQLMLFLVKISVKTVELPSEDGSKEIRRKEIKPEAITQIILSARFRPELEKTKLKDDKRVIFVESEGTEKLVFSYKDEWGDPQTITIKKEVSVPAYEKALESMALNKDLKKEPLITHMTRLWSPSQEVDSTK
ncbi:hypothetical protein [Candidatus Neptunochlamydia vexilliferae]|uniref:Uncharacterized protein n=1 Tax=Candidatus Neptunichlamydia vexilliferae TaxID=1651774 RepID=A0ABS0B3D6_9BACT|nr:hypothetical protein [Candidatus Neptunochlamydia vexilliferae]MBF5060261.1 hypothetical protein [Candidatus Neptunochlamydia vexilliferae]